MVSLLSASRWFCWFQYDTTLLQFEVGAPCTSRRLQEASVNEVINDLARGARVELRLCPQLRHRAGDRRRALEGGQGGQEDLTVLALSQRRVGEPSRADRRRAVQAGSVHRPHDGHLLLRHLGGDPVRSQPIPELELKRRWGGVQQPRASVDRDPSPRVPVLPREGIHLIRRALHRLLERRVAEAQHRHRHLAGLASLEVVEELRERSRFGLHVEPRGVLGDERPGLRFEPLVAHHAVEADHALHQADLLFERGGAGEGEARDAGDFDVQVRVAAAVVDELQQLPVRGARLEQAATHLLVPLLFGEAADVEHHVDALEGPRPARR